MDGLLMIAMNKHREICSIQSSGGIMLLKEQVNPDNLAVVILVLQPERSIILKTLSCRAALLNTHRLNINTVVIL